MRYNQLTLEKRYHISALQKQGLKQYEIAREIEVHPSTISRELKRNSDKDGNYKPYKAEVKTFLRDKNKVKYNVMTQIIE